MRSIRARLSSDNLNKSGKEAQKELKKLSLSLHENGGFVEVSIRGEGTIFSQRFSWDVNCRSEVYIK
jgi:DNA-binding protein YbaB